MRNPWEHDQVPEDGAIGTSRQWVRIFGALMWLAVIVTFGVLIFTDIGGEQTAAVTVQVLQLTIIIVVICVIGWMIQRLLRRLKLLDGTLVNLFTMLSVFTLLMLVGIAAHQMGFLEGAVPSELSKVAPIDQWQEQVYRRTIDPIEDVLPWS